MTMVLRHRAVAGEAADPATVPAPVAWLNGVFSSRDAGPFTVNEGYVGFRTGQNLAAETKWFVWATPPVDEGANEVHRQLRFVKCLTLDVQVADELTPTFGNDYGAVCGSWRGPGEDGLWPTEKFVWFRVHQYANGQLGPGVVMKGRIQVEL